MITNYQKHSILQMRRGGMTFAEIGEALGLSSNTVKSVCRRNTLKEQQDGHLPGTVCKNCGEPLKQTPGARRKVFCSNHCRYEWWNRTRAKKPYLLTCYHCGRAVYQLRQPEAEVLRAGMLSAQPLWGGDCPNGQGTAGA